MLRVMVRSAQCFLEICELLGRTSSHDKSEKKPTVTFLMSFYERDKRKSQLLQAACCNLEGASESQRPEIKAFTKVKYL